jgi:hypothetical protein
MSEQEKRRLYMPPRNIIGSLLSLTIVTWYFVDKVGGDRTPLKVAIVGLAIVAQIGVVLVSSRTRQTRRPFFWQLYDLLTGKGRLPYRLVVSALVVIVILALGFEIAGLQPLAPRDGFPESFIIRFVEVDIYWSVINFLGISDNSIGAGGASQLLTVLATISGLLFWGMFISILVNKHLEIQFLERKGASPVEEDQVYYNEAP